MDQEQIWFDSFDFDLFDWEVGFVYGCGCYQCSNIGYKGCIGVYELLEMDECMLDVFWCQDVLVFIWVVWQGDFYCFFGYCVMDYVLQGLIILEEVVCVVVILESDFFEVVDVLLLDDYSGNFD